MFGMLHRRPLTSSMFFLCFRRLGSSLCLGFGRWHCGGKIQACQCCVLLNSRIHNPREEHLGASDIDLGFNSFVIIFVVKEGFGSFHFDFAFLILVSISMSSFNSSVMMDPRYFNLFTKWTFLLLARMISSGRIFFQNRVLLAEV